MKNDRLPDTDTDEGFDFYEELMGSSSDIQPEDLAYLSIQEAEDDPDDLRFGHDDVEQLSVIRDKDGARRAYPHTPTRDEYYEHDGRVPPCSKDWHAEPAAMREQSLEVRLANGYGC